MLQTQLATLEPLDGGVQGEQSAVWRGVDRLIDRAASLSDLAIHRLHLLAGPRLRAQGEPVPVELVNEERLAALRTLVAPMLLGRVREAYDGPIVLMKGLEIAASYPDPALRPTRDLDLLVGDPDGAQRALLAAGFEPIGGPDSYYELRHHLRPLILPGSPLMIEIHRRPEWVKWGKAPEVAELLEAAVPARAGVEGILALPPAQHALVVAAHSWSEVPLRRALDLVDTTLLASEADPAELDALARRWGIDRLWSSTESASAALLLGDPMPWSLRTWARDIRDVRDRSVLENHVRRVVSTFWALPPHRAVGAAGRALVSEVSPAPGDSWGTKLRRTRRALRNALSPLTHHDGDGR